MADQVRVDKWLWAVRIFKTRSTASEACRKGRIFIGDHPVKPSRIIKIGELIKVRKSPVTYHFKVLALAEKRMGAGLVADFMKDVTPEEELDLLNMQRNMGRFHRDRGTGRPTKKERRDLDDFFEVD